MPFGKRDGTLYSSPAPTPTKKLYLLSGELVTKLTGRYIEFEMFPLTFDEYLGMKEFLGKTISHDVVAEFDEFLRQGGFPKALQYDNPEDRKTYISSVIAEIFQKDIKKRIKMWII